MVVCGYLSQSPYNPFNPSYVISVLISTPFDSSRLDTFSINGSVRYNPKNIVLLYVGNSDLGIAISHCFPTCLHSALSTPFISPSCVNWNTISLPISDFIVYIPLECEPAPYALLVSPSFIYMYT